MALRQNVIALVNIKIAGKWVFTLLILIIIGFDTHPYEHYVSLHDSVPKKHIRMAIW